jgi:hypothetical protein
LLRVGLAGAGGRSWFDRARTLQSKRCLVVSSHPVVLAILSARSPLPTDKFGHPQSRQRRANCAAKLRYRLAVLFGLPDPNREPPACGDPSIATQSWNATDERLAKGSEHSAGEPNRKPNHTIDAIAKSCASKPCGIPPTPSKPKFRRSSEPTWGQARPKLRHPRRRS